MLLRGLKVIRYNRRGVMAAVFNPRQNLNKDSRGDVVGSVRFNSGFLRNTTGAPYTVEQKLDSHIVLQPWTYMTSLKSKQVLPKLASALNVWVQAPQESLGLISSILQDFQNASLMVDDVEDDSVLRREKPAAHVVFGPAQTINTANFVLVRTIQAGRRLQNPNAVDIILEELENLHVGQGLDLFWKYEVMCPSEAEYFKMIDNKTGGFFRMLIRLMQAEAGRSDLSFARFTHLLGRAYQVRDDYMNLMSEDYERQKGRCEDLDEGKLSYPIVKCLQGSAQAYQHRILEAFRHQRVTSHSQRHAMPDENKDFIMECLRSSGALKETLSYLKRLELELDHEIGLIEEQTALENPSVRVLLKSLRVEGEDKS